MPKNSTRAIKLDPNFLPLPVDDGDELFQNGIFQFNITKMLEYIQKNPGCFPLEKVLVSDFFKDFSSITEDHLSSVDVSLPVILAEISPGRYNLIDGNHRMEKARRMGIISLSANKLSVEQHMRFLTSKKAYAIFIDYWNDKVKMKSKKARKDKGCDFS
jgi:hypothetical protein